MAATGKVQRKGKKVKSEGLQPYSDPNWKGFFSDIMRIIQLVSTHSACLQVSKMR